MYKIFKRLLDIIAALILIILLSPILLITAFLVKVTSKGPIIFKQERLGKNGKVYKMWKFRSMCVGAEKMEGGVYCEKGDVRVTKFGNFIRKTSLDELPQLWNILKGDMSFIGFRSPLTYHPWTFDKYTEEQKKMFSVRPGLTGYAQIHGRKSVEWNKRIEYNVYYAEHISLWLDLKIIFKTIFVIFRTKDNVNNGKTVKEETKTDEASQGE